MRNKLPRLIGPAFLVAIGYLDPGNWATDLEAGARYKYDLLWMVLVASVMAMLLQHLCIRLGAYRNVDLAEACRLFCPKWTVIPLYVLAEVAIIACDLADVIGTAIACRLLFGLPLIYGVLLTSADVLLLMSGIVNGGNERYMNYLMAALLLFIAGCFAVELAIVRPDPVDVLKGFLRINILSPDPKYWMTALGILGATVMPHNLYLHSYLAKHNTAAAETNTCADAKSDADVDDGSRKVKLLSIDMVVALTVALLVNCSILIVSSAAFHGIASSDVPRSLEDAAMLLNNLMGRGSFLIFGIALLVSGFSSTVTGTLAGQIVFEGFLNIEMVQWKRKLITRSLAVVPALVIIILSGERAFESLLFYSQVILSFQLPFAMVPLVIFAFPHNANSTPHDGLWTPILKLLSTIVAAAVCTVNLGVIVLSFRNQ